MREDDQQPDAPAIPAEATRSEGALQSRRALLRIATLGSAAVVTVKPGMAQAAVSAITCSIPVPQSSQAGKWIKKDGSVVNPNTANSYDPPDIPLKGEDVRNSLAYGTRYSGYAQAPTDAFNKYIQNLTMGKQGYTCYSSIQRQL